MRAGLISGTSVLSFSPLYFRREWGIGYEQVTPENIDSLPALVEERGWRGFNVTTPYKEAVLQHAHQQVHPVDKIAAANTIVVEPEGTWTARNTDYEAARELLSLYAQVHGAWEEVWILGTGGAARAAGWAHAELFPARPIRFFSREPHRQLTFPHPHEVLAYDRAAELSAGQRKLVVQATPVGSFPQVQALPPLSLLLLRQGDIVWDLIYNVNPTRFLQIARAKGCTIEGGMQLFRLQAQKSLGYWFAAHKALYRALSRKA